MGTFRRIVAPETGQLQKHAGGRALTLLDGRDYSGRSIAQTISAPSAPRSGAAKSFMDAKLIRELEHFLPAGSVLSKLDDLMLYEYDGSVEVARPECVVFPRSTDDVVHILELSNHYRVPLVGRGAGTGLSGGARTSAQGPLALCPSSGRGARGKGARNGSRRPRRAT